MYLVCVLFFVDWWWVRCYSKGRFSRESAVLLLLKAVNECSYLE